MLLGYRDGGMEIAGNKTPKLTNGNTRGSTRLCQISTMLQGKVTVLETGWMEVDVRRFRSFQRGNDLRSLLGRYNSKTEVRRNV